MLSETIATDPGTHLYSISFLQSSIRTLDLILFNIFSPFPGYFSTCRCTTHQRTFHKFPSSKAPEISEGVLFNICKSLIKDWGPESVGALPEDSMQQLLKEVSYPSDTSET